MNSNIERILKSWRIGVVIGLAGLAACGSESCPDECSAVYSSRSGGYSVGTTYNENTAAASCPKGCDLIKENKDSYCCWCPDN